MSVKVMITGPSLDSAVNVSGISSVIDTLIHSVPKSEVRYTHFVVGSRDGDPKRFVWLLRQVALPFVAFFKMWKFETEILHLNMPLNVPAMIRDSSILAVAKVSGRKAILHVHGGRYLDQSPGFSIRWLIKMLFRTADKVIVLSPSEKLMVSELYGITDAEYICNAIRAPGFNDVISRKEKTELSCIYLGRLVESKGISEIVEAFTKIDEEISLRVFGAGEMQHHMVSSLRDALGDRFFYGGVLVGRSKFVELRQSDVLILPSRHGEGLPIVLLEAMLCGVPIIASGIGSIPWAIRHDIDGIIIRPYSSSDLLAALSTLRKSSIRERLSISAERRCRKLFSADRQARKFVMQYAQLIRAGD